MISAEHLVKLERHLDNLTTKESGELEGFQAQLEEIYNLDEYRDWLANGQFASSKSLRSRFQIPSGFRPSDGISTSSSKWTLENYGLLNGAFLEAKIDKHHGRIHLTDGPWAEKAFRVYSYTDESERILEYLQSTCATEEFDLFVDPACGCGHHGIGLSSIEQRISLDINLRALAFCRINAILCEVPQMLCGLNDLRDGLPSPLNLLSSESCLVAINMPFAIFPKQKGLPQALAQDGGDRGAELTFAALGALRQFADRSKLIKKFRFVVLFYSLGCATTDSWEVVDRAKQIFPDGSVTHSILSDEKMWRIDGKKEQVNPMPLELLRLKGECKHTYSEIDRKNAVEGYVRLQNSFESQGYSHLGYGLLDIAI